MRSAMRGARLCLPRAAHGGEGVRFCQVVYSAASRLCIAYLRQHAAFCPRRVAFIVSRCLAPWRLRAQSESGGES